MKEPTSRPGAGKNDRDPLAGLVPPAPPAALRAAALGAARRAPRGREGSGPRRPPAAGARLWHWGWAAAVVLLVVLHLRLPEPALRAAGPPGAPGSPGAPAPGALEVEGVGPIVGSGVWSARRDWTPAPWNALDPRWRAELRKEELL